MKKIIEKPENIFFIICLFWGVLFLLINPPFQAPDEDAHLFKMWGYTNGSLNFQVLNNYAGHVLPENFVLLQKYYKTFRLDKTQKTSLKELQSASALKLEKNKSEFLNFTPTSYTPLSYFPSFVILFVLKFLNFNPVSIIFIMRFCSLFIYLALCYTAIKIIPTNKLLMFFVTLLPVNLYQAGAISTDALTMGLVFLFIAYTFKLKFKNDDFITKKEVAVWSILITLISLCKYAYFPLILLFFTIPFKNFDKSIKPIPVFFFTVLLNLFLIAVFLNHVVSVFHGVTTEMSQITIDKKILIIDLFQHPIVYLKGVLFTVFKCFSDYKNMMIASFGWDFTSVPAFIASLFYVILLLSTLVSSETEKDFYYCWRDKIIFLISAVLIFLATITSVYLIYQRFPLIAGIQGRYLFCLIPLVFFMLKPKIYSIKLPSFVLIMFTQILMLVSLLSLVNRFY